MNAKRIMITAAFILLAGVCTSATAQRKTGLILSSDGPPRQQEYSVKVNAIEASEGTVAVDYKFGESLFGYSFLGRTTGDLGASLMLSMNCSPAVFVPGGMNEMIGGSWTLPVYANDKSSRDIYLGSLYGTIKTGRMAWDKSGTIAEVSVILVIENGTKTWEGRRGYAEFAGTLDDSGKFEVLTGEMHIILE